MVTSVGDKDVTLWNASFKLALWRIRGFYMLCGVLASLDVVLRSTY